MDAEPPEQHHDDAEQENAQRRVGERDYGGHDLGHDLGKRDIGDSDDDAGDHSRADERDRCGNKGGERFADRRWDSRSGDFDVAHLTLREEAEELDCEDGHEDCSEQAGGVEVVGDEIAIDVYARGNEPARGAEKRGQKTLHLVALREEIGDADSGPKAHDAHREVEYGPDDTAERIGEGGPSGEEALAESRFKRCVIHRRFAKDEQQRSDCEERNERHEGILDRLDVAVPRQAVCQRCDALLYKADDLFHERSFLFSIMSLYQ